MKSCQLIAFGNSNLLRKIQFLLKSGFRVLAFFILLDEGYLVTNVVNFVYKWGRQLLSRHYKLQMSDKFIFFNGKVCHFQSNIYRQLHSNLKKLILNCNRSVLSVVPSWWEKETCSAKGMENENLKSEIWKNLKFEKPRISLSWIILVFIQVFPDLNCTEIRRISH